MMENQKEIGITFKDIIQDKLKNSNISVLGVGDPGTGKSYTSILLANDIDQNFNLDNIVFNAIDYIKKIDEAKEGEAVIFDDAGRGIPARDWNSLSNKLISYTQETVRYLKQVIFWNTPDTSMIDKIPHKLFQFVIYSKYPGFAKLYELKHDRLNGKTFFQFPQLAFRSRIYTIDHLKIKIKDTDKEILKQYQDKKAVYLKKDRGNMIKRLENMA